MFAFRIQPGSEEALKPMLNVPDFEVEEGVVYYVIVDPILAQKVVSSKELDEIEAETGEEYIRFQ